MDEITFREHTLAELRGIATALLALSEAQRELASALRSAGRQGTLRVRIEAPTPKKRRKVRVK